MIAILAPGQGAQRPGMLSTWLTDPQIVQSLERASKVAGLDLIHLGTQAGAGEIRDTAVAQPLIVALGIAVAERLGLIGAPGLVVAGHSVGEVTAAAVAGVLTPEQAVAFAARRGAAMASACSQTQTGMAAMIGPGVDAVLKCFRADGLSVANHNGAGQVVVAGPCQVLARLKQTVPSNVRVITLDVAGAFHTQHMAGAEAELRGHARTIRTSDPRSTLLSNADGAAVNSGREVLERLVNQVTSPVRWDLCMRSCRERGITVAVELAPAGALTGLAKRQLDGTRLLTANSPADLDTVRELLAHAS